MIKIINISKDDEKKYLELVKEFYNSPAVLHNVSENNFKNTFNEVINSNIYAEAFFIYFESNLAGYLLISKTYSQEAGGMVLLIEEIYLREEFRNKKIGQEIFKFLDYKFKDFKRFRLEVNKENEKAIKLYKKIGFNELNYIQMILKG